DRHDQSPDWLGDRNAWSLYHSGARAIPRCRVVTYLLPRRFSSSDSISLRSRLSEDASERFGQGNRSTTIGGAERSSTTPVPKGIVRIRSGCMIGTRRIECWLERDP